MIKVVSFDIGGTLVENDSEGKYSLQELAKLINVDYDKVKKSYKENFQKKEGTFDELVELFCKQLEIKKTKIIERFFMNKFQASSRVCRDVLPVLKQIKDMGYKIILFSNTCCLFKDSLTPEIKKIVDNIFYSYQIGHTKNEKESYEYIEKQMGYQKNEFLHIGDTLSSDYLNPIKNGWQALFYGYAENIECISKLSEVIAYLNK